MADGWDAATFAGTAAAQARRHALLTPQQRLAWLEAALHDAARAGALDHVRRRRQQEALAAWSGSSRT